MPPAQAASGYAAVVDEDEDDDDDGQPGPPPGPPPGLGGLFLPVRPSLLLNFFFISFFLFDAIHSEEFCWLVGRSR